MTVDIKTLRARIAEQAALLPPEDRHQLFESTVFGINVVIKDLVALLNVYEAAQAWSEQPGLDWKSKQGSAFGRENHALLEAVRK